VVGKAVGGAARAGAWSAIDIVVRQSVQFIVSVVLARLLSPADFGISALVFFFTGFGIALVEGGFATALIQRQDTTRQQESALFWMGLALSAGLGLLLVLLAPFIAEFYGYLVLEPLMWLAALHLQVVAVGVVPTALMIRALRFDLLAKIALLGALISGAVAIVSAAMGAGVWALALQLLTFWTVHSAVVWVVAGWSPVARVRGTGAGRLLKFSQRVGFTSLLDHLYVQGFALLVGKFYGVPALGIYNRAHATQNFLSGTLATILRRLTLPLLSSRASDPELLRATMRRTTRMAMLVTLPVMGGLAVASDLVVLTLFGREWLSAAPILTVLAIAGVFLPLQMINAQLLLALDRPELFSRVEVIKKSVGIAMILIGSTFGLIGLAWSQVAFSLFAHFFNGHFSGRVAGYGAFRQIGDALGLAAVSAVMIAALLFLRPLLHREPLLLLVEMALIGTAIFVVLGFLLRLEAFREGTDTLRSVFRLG
jgi:O-antigen/teichoic acid export membrane protein